MTDSSLDLGFEDLDETCVRDGCTNRRWILDLCEPHYEARERFKTKLAESAKTTRPRAAPKVVPTGKAALICPHCQVQGQVRTRKTRRKQGISGGKATGAVLTLGLSTLLTGLSRKQTVTEMRCGNCRTTWTV